MLEVIAAAFPGSRLRIDQGAIAGPLHYEGQFHSIRLRFDPFLEVFVDLPPLDDFELLIQWGDRWLGDTNLGDPEIDNAYFIRTNDPLLARTWLDERARRALVKERMRNDAYTASELERIRLLRTIDSFDLTEPKLRRPWTIEIRHGRMSSTRGLKLLPPEEVIESLEVVAAIAGASGRWGQRCSELALLTGARVKQITDRIELGATAILLEQQRVDVEVRYLRRDAGTHDRLTTRVRGNRASASNVVWSVVDDDVPRGPLPSLPAGEKVRAPRPLRHLDARCSHEDAPLPFSLVEPLFVREADKARAVIVTESDVTVWFDGAVLAAEPIAIATKVVAQLATDAGLAEGPYR
jgi:hypothetical protein